MSSPLLPCQPGLCGSLLSVTAGLSWWASGSPFSTHHARPTGCCSLSLPVPQQGSAVAAVAGLGVWHHQGLMLSELNYFFKSKHCKAVEPRVFHSWPCAGYRGGVPGSGVLPGKDRPLSSGIVLCPGLPRG